MSENADSSRRNFLIGATSVVGAAGVAGVAVPFLGSWNPSAKARAAGAPVKIDISKLQSGQILGPLPAWRDMPIFIVKRTDAQIENLNKEAGRLADPEMDEPQQPDYARNETRSIKPDVLVLVGICTHLSCSPKFFPMIQPEQFDPNWLGGFYCPCHGSKFDLSGKVYAGVPAPTNLQVPPHYYESDSVIVIGEEAPA